MSVLFEFRRHSIKDGRARGVIGPMGSALAREVGRTQLRGRAFTHFYASTLWRTHQTLAAFYEGANEDWSKTTPEHAPFYLDWPQLTALWKVCAEGDKRGEDMLQTALRHDADLAYRAALEVAERFRAWAATFRSGSEILVVGHSPYMELIPLGLHGEVIRALRECQGFRIRVEAGTCAVDTESPDLDPSGLRRRLFSDTYH